jgi:enoyl-CoA hydratase/carnithine racemase
MTALACTYGRRGVGSVEVGRFEQILVTAEAGTATVTLNRPDRYNALGSRIVDELVEAVESIEGTGEVRTIVLTGAGDKAFCSGVDLKERAEMDADGRWSHNRALGAFAEKRKPEFPPLISRRIT